MPAAPAAGTAGTAPAGAGSLNLSTTPPPAGSSSFTATPAPTNKAVLVSSAPARSATAANVTKLQTVTGNTVPIPSDSKNNGQNVSGDVDKNYAIKPGETVDQYNSRVGSYNTAKEAAAAKTGGGSGAGTGTGSSATPGNDGTGTGDPYDAAVKGVKDPALAGMYKSSLQNLDTQISNAQSNISAIQARSMNDPAITGIVSTIMQKYDQQIQLLKARNTQMLGKANTSVAAFGGLGTMSQDFLNDEQNKWDGQIQTLQGQEDSMIAKAQAAYATGNMKDLNDAMTAYSKANQDKLDALGKLLDASQKAVTESQAQQRLDQQATKDQLSSDVTTSTKIAAGVAANIAASGLTDEKHIKDYVNQLATQYGITNPDILYSQVVSAQATNKKADLSEQNIESQMNARSQAEVNATKRLALAEEKNANGPKKTAGEIKDDFYSGLVQLQGAKMSDGTPFYLTAGDGKQYLTKDGFTKILDAAKQDGISRAAFIKDNPDVFSPDAVTQDSNPYGLTAKEKAVIQQ